MVSHPEQGWILLCNGLVLFEDGGELLPSGKLVEPSESPARIRHPPERHADLIPSQ
jgi:uncharacterized protein DUF5999